MPKTYKLNSNPVDNDGNEVQVDAEDRTIVIKEEIEQSLLDQLPESVRNEISSKEERVTIANLKQEHEEAIESAKQAIKKANEIAEKINEITSEFSDLGITGAPSEVLDDDKIVDLDSKKPVQRKKKK